MCNKDMIYEYTHTHTEREFLADSGIFQTGQELRKLRSFISWDKLIFSNICYRA